MCVCAMYANNAVFVLEVVYLPAAKPVADAAKPGSQGCV